MTATPTDAAKRRSWLWPLLLVLLLSGAALADWLAEPSPLSDVHWDASIYLLSAKSFVAGGVFQYYEKHASTLHDAVMHGDYSSAYRAFMRLGHTVLLGSMVAFTGTDERSIAILTWAYRVVLSIGLFFSAILPVTLGRLTRERFSETALYLGAAISLLLYLLSDTAAYLSGNLVSEVPAIALIGLSAWSLIKAWESRSPAYALVSGLAALLLYTARMESVWLYLALILALAWLTTRDSASVEGGRRAVFLSAAAALSLFCIYSWLFFPLTDPRLFVSFAQSQARTFAADYADLAVGIAPRIRIVYQLVAANGLLWVGVVLGLPLLRTSRGFQVGSLWLLLALVPVAVALVSLPATEIRMYTTLAPPLFVLSTLGWTRFSTEVARGFSLLKPGIVVVVCFMLILISQPFTYAYLRTLPGMWRLQFVRQFLAPMPFERIDLHVPELARVYREIARQRNVPVIVASPGMQGADHIMVLEYLAPSVRDEPNDASATSGARLANGSTVLVHASLSPEDDLRFIASTPRDRAVWLLRNNEESNWETGFDCCGTRRKVLVTKHYTLSELVRDAPGR